MSDGWNLILPFDTDDPQFRRGVEVGTVWGRLKATPGPFAVHVRSENAEMMLRMAEAQRRTVRALPGGDDDEWVVAEFGEAAP